MGFNEKDSISDPSTKQKKLKYPKSVGFIISNEFCERFNFYGMRAILVLYLTRRLGYNDDDATVMFHIFTMLVYFFPLFGAIIADSWLGRFKTILYLSMVYTIGSVIISLGAIPTLNLPAKAVTVIGLLLISVGTGGIKPCVAAFGGDQFKLPEQALQLASFFSYFYMAINAGSLISTTLTPILREDVHCFGEESCFSLAFGVPGALMVVSIVVFIIGKPFYSISKPTGNMIVNVSKCIWDAIKIRCKERVTNPQEHWLDYAEPKHGKRLVEDIKILLKILVLYIPIPYFWALLDQQGSRWTFQATQMDGRTGSITIKPEQIQVINPLLIVVFIPLFDLFLYPLLRKIGINHSLHRMTFGLALGGIAFFVSGLLQLRLEQDETVLPNIGESQLKIFNGLPCDYQFQTDLPAYGNQTIMIPSLGMFIDNHVPVSIISNNVDQFKFVAKPIDQRDKCQEVTGNFLLKSEQAISYLLTSNSTDRSYLISYQENLRKSDNGQPRLRILSTFDQPVNINFTNSNSQYSQIFKSNLNETDLKEIHDGEYIVAINGKDIGYVNLIPGGSYTVLITQMLENSYVLRTYTIVEPNYIHIFWQLPQFIIITAAEILFSVTGLEFSFTESPDSMKSVLQACWLITVAFGNGFVVIITELKIFDKQSHEFFLFSGLMVIDILLFIWLSSDYRKNRTDTDSSITETDVDQISTEIDKKIDVKVADNHMNRKEIMVETNVGKGQDNLAYSSSEM